MGMVQDNVAENCEAYYERYRRQAHVTPKSYLSFLEGYKVLYTEKHKNIAEMAKRFSISRLITIIFYTNITYFLQSIYNDLIVTSFVWYFRMTTGLDKLQEAAESVDELKKELELKDQEIKVATAKAEEVRR